MGAGDNRHGNEPTMIGRWTDWKPFPDAYYGEHIQAPIGPGVYEVCHASTREQVAFGCTHNVAEALSNVVKPGRFRGRSLFRLFGYSRYLSSELEYRTWATASLADAKVAVSQLLGQRQAVLRRFSQTAPPYS